MAGVGVSGQKGGDDLRRGSRCGRTAEVQKIAHRGLLLGVEVVFAWMWLAVSVKRAHDRGKPGTWLFVLLIPLAGPIWVLVELGFLAGPKGPNK